MQFPNEPVDVAEVLAQHHLLVLGRQAVHIVSRHGLSVQRLRLVDILPCLGLRDEIEEEKLEDLELDVLGRLFALEQRANGGQSTHVFKQPDVGHFSQQASDQRSNRHVHSLRGAQQLDEQAHVVFRGENAPAGLMQQKSSSKQINGKREMLDGVCACEHAFDGRHEV